MSEDWRRSALKTLTRLAQRQQSTHQWLRAALHGRLESLREAAFETAIETGEPIGTLLAEEAELVTEEVAGNLLWLGEREPYINSIHLLELCYRLTERRLAVLQERVDAESSVTERGELARTMGRLSIYLAKLGQPERSLLVAHDALEIYLDLSDHHPAFRPAVVVLFHKIANLYSRLGPREDALWYYSLAADFWRLLSQPQRHTEDLARIFADWAVEIKEERKDEAIELVSKAVQIWQALPSRDYLQRSHLAKALVVLGNMRSSAGELDKALSSIHAGCDILRELSTERPDVFLDSYATTLNELSFLLDDLGRPTEALEAAEQAVNVFRSLHRDKPESYSEGLATSIDNLALLLGSLDRPLEALEVTREAVRLRQFVVIKHTELTAQDFIEAVRDLQDLLSALEYPLEEVVALEEETLRLVLPEALKFPVEVRDALVLLKDFYLESARVCHVEPDREILKLVQEVETAAKHLASAAQAT